MGGLVYSTAFSSDNNTYTQMIEWHNFMGGNAFCFKVCDPSNEHAADYCQHIYDRIGYASPCHIFFPSCSRQFQLRLQRPEQRPGQGLRVLRG